MPLTRFDEPITLPSEPQPPNRANWPLLAACVPVIGGVVMWLITGSMIALAFAALGPLMAIAAVVDRARGARKHRKTALVEFEAACDDVTAEIDRRHALERSQLAAERPDAAALLADPSMIWRSAADEITLGLGDVASSLRVSGGDGEVASRLRARASLIPNVPVSYALADGVCVRGEAAVAMAVARALVVQACLRAAPRELAVTCEFESEGWADGLPHSTLLGQPTQIHWGARAEDATIPLCVISPDEAVPEACGVLIDVGVGLRSIVRRGAHEEHVGSEACSREQAEQIAAMLQARAPTVAGEEAAVVLAELEPQAAPLAGGARLPCVIGVAGGVPVTVDIVQDGPHALVVGTTGAGKSELLVTWVTSLARTYTPDRVVFLLADFKGGTAFDALRALPHVTGVITDLDAALSRRAVESLRAELRRRERALASAGLRDVAEGADIPRLVIVVDEFAAMLQEHPDLHAVFTDVAARGRALGMHLVLGTQRSTGVVRDALAANCPLRIALRVSEAAESRGVIGTDAAALLPGTVAGRGLAYVRRPSDGEPKRLRVALTATADIAALRDDSEAARPDGPWIEPLPSAVSYNALRAVADRDAVPAEAVLIGLADEPELQRQRVVQLRGGIADSLAVIGASGSGKSALCRVVAQQAFGVIEIPRGAEAAWDALEAAETLTDCIVIIDDLDAILARYPNEYALAVAERVEHIVRDASERRVSVIVTVQRTTGATAKILDLFSRRALLRTATKSDHATAGGDLAAWTTDRQPGRALLDGREVQLALPDAVLSPATPEADSFGDDGNAVWRPTAPLTAVVARAPHRRAVSLRHGWGADVRVILADELTGGAPPRADDGHPVVIVADGEGWQRQYALLGHVRQYAQFVVAAECATDLRVLTGERELPPFARTRASRAWLVADGHAPRRIVLPRHE